MPSVRETVLKVADDMERHVSGVEGMEDSPVARWARELRKATHQSDEPTTVSAYDLLSDRERSVLDMWPRFEDGEPVMVGDEFNDHESRRNDVYRLTFYESGISIRTDSGTLDWQAYGEHVKRPEPKDTWEKWRIDCKLDVREYIRCIMDEDVPSFFSVAREMMVRDLERRAKALCERGAE